MIPSLSELEETSIILPQIKKFKITVGGLILFFKACIVNLYGKYKMEIVGFYVMINMYASTSEADRLSY